MNQHQKDINKLCHHLEKKRSRSLQESEALKVLVNGLQTTNTKIDDELQVAKANYKRELELNNILMKKCEAQLNSEETTILTSQQSLGHNNNQPANDEENRQIEPKDVHNKDKDNSASTGSRTHDKQSLRGPCCFEFVQEGSCYFKKGCMFSHAITEASRQNKDLQAKMKEMCTSKRKLNEQKRKLCANEFLQKDSCPYRNSRKGCNFSHVITEEMRNDEELKGIMQQLTQRKVAARPEAATSDAGFCQTTFENGPNSCNGPCKDKHRLDFRRIQRGLCHYHILGDCKWGDKCMFTHEVPSCIKSRPDVVQAARAFIENQKKHKLTTNNSINNRLKNLADNTLDDNVTTAVPEKVTVSKESAMNKTSDQNRGAATVPAQDHHQNRQTNMTHPFLWDMRRTIQDQTTQPLKNNNTTIAQAPGHLPHLGIQIPPYFNFPTTQPLNQFPLYIPVA